VLDSSYPAEEKLVLKTMRSSAVVAVLAVGLAACSEGPTAPTGPTFDISEPLLAKGSSDNSGNGNSGKGSSPGRGKDVGIRKFTIYPGVDVQERFGDHVLKIPADVTCDPATSGYGAAFWELACARATRPIEVTATWTVWKGTPVISFSRDLRFVPSKREREWVTLSLKTTGELKPSDVFTILWYDKEARRWVDESLTDPTLKAHAVNGGDLVKRRLKHFSDWALWVGLGSYNVTSGLGGDVDVWGGW
jgi:hypothetical protein